MKNLKYILFLAVTFVITSCSKSKLELVNPNDVQASNFWKSETDALQGVLGVYDAFQNDNVAGNQYFRLDVMTDNLSTNTNSDSWLDLRNFAGTGLSSRVTGFWRWLFTVVNRANLVIEKVAAMPAASISDASRTMILAEAKFLRAYAYHDLIMIYQGVPFYTKPNQALSEGIAPIKGSVVADSLINDLIKNVIPNIPLTDVNGKGRATRGAAIALLGKLYMAKQDFVNAKATLRLLKQPPYSYSLYPNFARLFTPEDEFNNEAIFQINFTASQLDGGEAFSFRIDTTTNPAVTPFGAPRNAYQVVNQFRDSYLYTDGRPRTTSSVYGATSPLINNTSQAINRDPRFRATFFNNLDTTASRKRYWNFTPASATIFPGTVNSGSVAVKKYFFISPIVYTNGNPQNFYLIRYADVLLMLAEAELEVDPSDPDIFINLQMIRNRAGIAMFTSTAWAALSTDNKRIAIRDERRWEFGFEHVRFFDFRRWGAAYTKQRLQAINTSIPVGTPDLQFVQWPYPQQELDNNPALKATGNPGW
jgi:hypothetical protein